MERSLPLILGASVVGLLVVVMYVLSAIRTKSPASKREPLGIPRGSVRSLLAVLIVGSFIVFLLFGESVANPESFDKVLAAFAAIAGSAIGYYFGERPRAAENAGGEQGQGEEPPEGDH